MRKIIIVLTAFFFITPAMACDDAARAIREQNRLIERQGREEERARERQERRDRDRDRQIDRAIRSQGK